MQTRYKQAFNQSKAAFVPFTVLGWPDAERCYQTIKTMIDEGATALELGVAFSDPVADGPVIQQATTEVLDSGFDVEQAFRLLCRVRAYNASVPIGLLTYLNVVLARGAEQFFEEAARCGVDSVLIADLPPDAADEVAPHADAHGVALVFIVSPLTTTDRLSKIAGLSKAYIYVVSRLGITGAQETHDDQLEQLLERTKKVTAVPMLVGFGISSPSAARNMLAIGADGVISGSKVIEIIRQDAAPGYPLLSRFLQDMRAAISDKI
ncbi:MAG TPA: tryptophan synthase subunit alpha [Candidatus Obscuribacterales bacterium]